MKAISLTGKDLGSEGASLLRGYGLLFLKACVQLKGRALNKENNPFLSKY